MRILLALADPEAAAALSLCLSEAGFACDLAGGLVQARARLAAGDVDGVIVARDLPDGDGLDLVQGLRLGGSALPVIVCDPGASVMTRIFGLDAGADDYLAQSAAHDEIAAHLRALLRRSARRAQAALAFDAVARCLRIDDRAIDLTVREGDLMALLLRYPDRVVTRAQIEDEALGGRSPVGSNVVEVWVHRLRRKLYAAGDRIRIETVKGLGYRIRFR